MNNMPDVYFTKEPPYIAFHFHVSMTLSMRVCDLLSSSALIDVWLLIKRQINGTDNKSNTTELRLIKKFPHGERRLLFSIASPGAAKPQPKSV